MKISTENLEIADEDNPDNVRVSVQHGLRHGDLHPTTFSLSDLAAGIRYTHDHSDSFTDNIIFKISDGHNEVSESYADASLQSHCYMATL